MTKRELVIEVSEKLGYTQNEVSDVVQATLDTIIDTLAEGNRLEIRNFGVFEHKVRDARIGRNPRTGEAVPIPEKRIAVFKPGKSLKERVETGSTSVPESEGGPTGGPLSAGESSAEEGTPPPSEEPPHRFSP